MSEHETDSALAQSNRRPRGVMYALVAAALFGMSAPLAKALLNDATPQLLAGLLYAGSGAGLFIVQQIRRARATETEAPLTRRDAKWLAAAIAFGGILGPLLLMIGLVRTPAASGSLLLNLEGVFTAVIAWMVFHENVDGRIALGMAAIVCGGIALSWQGDASINGVAGPLAIAGACLCWAVDNNLTQKVSGGNPMQIAMFKGVFAGIVNCAIAFALGAHVPSTVVVVEALILGFVSYGISLVLFVLALRHLGTARTGAYFSVAPFVGTIVAVTVFREHTTSMLGVGAAFMALGVWLHLTERHAHEHVHEEMEHTHAHVHDQHHQHEHSADDPPGEPHSHAHRHTHLVHSHPHYPDIHHRHSH